jgi:hypothetical protein
MAQARPQHMRLELLLFTCRWDAASEAALGTCFKLSLLLLQTPAVGSHHAENLPSMPRSRASSVIK